jgi:hypothetical protein
LELTVFSFLDAFTDLFLIKSRFKPNAFNAW